jgi:Na+(H+)/acetate symporter ActP
MVMSSGYDALWYPVCYACGYLFLLLFIAGPLRRFGAYTIPDFAEGRFDSPVFRKIAVVFVLFIGFFYTMPQMKGAGTTLAYIFPGMPYWGGVVLVGAVITLNVALGGMKGITLVQAFQYWAKMFAISAPIFVLMAVYGHYGQQVELIGKPWPSGGVYRHGQGKSRITVETWIAVQPADWLDVIDKELPKGLPPAKRAVGEAERTLRKLAGSSPTGTFSFPPTQDPSMPHAVEGMLSDYSQVTGKRVFMATELASKTILFHHTNTLSGPQWATFLESVLESNSISLLADGTNRVKVVPTAKIERYRETPIFGVRKTLPDKAPRDETWLNPFGPLTTKAAKAAAAALTNRIAAPSIPLRVDLLPTDHMTVTLSGLTVTQALVIYADITGRQLLPRTNGMAERLDDALNGRLSQLNLVKRAPDPDSGVRVHRDGYFTPAQVKEAVETFFKTNGLALAPEGERHFRVVNRSEIEAAATKTSPQAWLAVHERPLALLYTYSLIIALVCGTAGLPHILVRFYTNPNGVAAKRTTMWVMILIGVFYLFPPIFGVLGRNLLPELYAGAGAKGTDKIVLELPRILNERYGAIGSILSGITCAGAFAAFMSTFSGLLVSMTGALAHDVYGRMLNPRATARQRLRAFRTAAVVIGGVAILIGTQVEPLQINFMVGQAFAIAAASYFPLLFMAVWWRKLTMKGAASGMLTGGLLALIGITLTSFSDLGWLKLAGFWAAHPLLRIVCEQPAIWTVPLAIVLMIVVSKLTPAAVPADIRMKMLVLHAPEQLGLKQEYIQEHQTH